VRLPIPPPGQARKAAKCTHGFGGCQLKARRGKFGRRERGASAPSQSRGGRRRGAESRSAGQPAPGGHSAGASRRAGKSVPSDSSVRPGSLVEGTVSANRAGYGFLRVEGFKESVFLSPPEMRGVMHGDRLRV